MAPRKLHEHQGASSMVTKNHEYQYLKTERFVDEDRDKCHAVGDICEDRDTIWVYQGHFDTTSRWISYSHKSLEISAIPCPFEGLNKTFCLIRDRRNNKLRWSRKSSIRYGRKSSGSKRVEEEDEQQGDDEDEGEEQLSSVRCLTRNSVKEEEPPIQEDFSVRHSTRNSVKGKEPQMQEDRRVRRSTRNSVKEEEPQIQEDLPVRHSTRNSVKGKEPQMQEDRRVRRSTRNSVKEEEPQIQEDLPVWHSTRNSVKGKEPQMQEDRPMQRSTRKNVDRKEKVREGLRGSSPHDRGNAYRASTSQLQKGIDGDTLETGGFNLWAQDLIQELLSGNPPEILLERALNGLNILESLPYDVPFHRPSVRDGTVPRNVSFVDNPKRKGAVFSKKLIVYDLVATIPQYSTTSKPAPKKRRATSSKHEPVSKRRKGISRAIVSESSEEVQLREEHRRSEEESISAFNSLTGEPAPDINGLDIITSLVCEQHNPSPTEALLAALTIYFTEKGLGSMKVKFNLQETPNVGWDEQSTVLTPFGHVTLPHNDPYSGSVYIWHLFGRKIWFLWPPTEHNLTKFYQQHLTPAHIHVKDLGYWVNELEQLEVVLMEDEEKAFVMPPHTLHACISLTTSAHAGEIFSSYSSIPPLETFIKITNQIEFKSSQTSDETRATFAEVMHSWDKKEKGIWTSLLMKMKKKTQKRRIQSWMQEMDDWSAKNAPFFDRNNK
ncbi:hypothetical protein PM082_018416 [Marasmius tenuissimus]|nr:hypothetical protein PM082_018416 [Marasmius tenuissimus]